MNLWGITAILFIFSDIDVDFCFHVVYFPPTIFFITYQYKSTNNWVCKMRQMWNFCGDGKSVTTTMNNWTCARWESFCVAKKTKGSCSVFIQVSTHDFDPKRIGFTHNSSASQILLTQTTLHNSLQPNQSRPSPTTRTTLWMWKLQKTRRLVKQSLFSFGHPKKKQPVTPSSSGQWVAKYFDKSKTPHFPHFQGRQAPRWVERRRPCPVS